MSNKEGTSGKHGDGRPLVPRLRFPEFLGAGEWTTPKLEEISVPINERVGARRLTPVSISAGIGFVPQSEKFGRDISGNQYRLYTVVRDGDFVYNKGNSLKFPQGCVYDLQDWSEVAAPNVFICFRLDSGYENGFFRYCFEKNIHGLQLKKHITSGARSNGLLNISKDAFFGIKIPTPKRAEQQKISDFLTYLDDLITLEAQKLCALKTHKKGLMQQLFPAEGETVPRLRFPEFRGAGEWKSTRLDELLFGHPDYGVNAPAVPYSEDLPAYLRITDISDEGYFLCDKKASVAINVTDENYLSEGDIVLARTGASVGKSYKFRKEDGKLVFAGFLIRIKPDPKKIDSTFLFNFLSTQQYWKWVGVTSARSGQPGINGNEYASLPIPVPPHETELSEQQKIANCLTSLDDLIAAQAQKVEALKTHKKGLMQQLFPKLEEV
ncbi:restriction endonuclease subunit S [Acidithiobacillus ferriphilus]|uniref:restriction endonuclease subunit S n=1 Tax=Acidithiobacillus ferriphilus TaxID=1689834 RepID=UPI001C075FD3|nr:restriction endonuclease subunit S [Acidithiobacillus ferriphilus]MBU2853526.1 restriction endonuclease subunit S [Acidithiobacillus ferriphilus]